MGSSSRSHSNLYTWLTHITRVGGGGTPLTGHEPPPLKQLLDFIARCEVFETTTRASTTSAKKVEAKSQPNVKRSQLPLNQNATSVKENMSFIIAKISWHFQYHKDSRKFANFASIACALLLIRQVNVLPVNARSGETQYVTSYTLCRGSID